MDWTTVGQSQAAQYVEVDVSDVTELQLETAGSDELQRTKTQLEQEKETHAQALADKDEAHAQELADKDAATTMRLAHLLLQPLEPFGVLLRLWPLPPLPPWLFLPSGPFLACIACLGI